MAFIIDTTKLIKWEDVKSDMNGVYTIGLRAGIWTIELTTDKKVKIVAKKKLQPLQKNQLYLRINSKKNVHGLSRSLFHLEDAAGQIVNSACLLQYQLDNPDIDSVEFEVPKHGNRKHGCSSYYPTHKSVLDRMKHKLPVKGATSVYHEMLQTKGGAVKISNPGEIPRGKQQVWQLNANVQRQSQEADVLAFFKDVDDPPILQHLDYPEDLWVLGTGQMCTDLSRFCTSKRLSYPFSVDPTFNFGQYNVTPFTYRHLLLKRKRTGVPPVFIGPTALHHSKTHITYKKITNAVSENVKGFRDCLSFMTDGEVALHTALSESFPGAVGLRCFMHFKRNCKEKLGEIGIRRSNDQSKFLEFVFGDRGVVNSTNHADLTHRLDTLQAEVDALEKKLLGKPEAEFWKYIQKNKEMFASSMIQDARIKGGMPLSDDGKPAECSTNQSESVNNILTRAKESFTGKTKHKRPLSKLEFIQHVWLPSIEYQEAQMQLALCGLSDDMELAPCAAYLLVDQETWFNWSTVQRDEYVCKFSNLTMKDVGMLKMISVDEEDTVTTSAQCVSTSVASFSFDLKAELMKLLKLDEEKADLMHREALKLLQCRGALQVKPTLDNKTTYLVAAKCKTGTYELRVNKDHVTCTCHAYKYNCVCKHGIVLADKLKILRKHLEWVAKCPQLSKPRRQALVQPAPSNCGKKGSKPKNSWRQARQPIPLNPRPYSEIHHNDMPLTVVFLEDSPKALSCKQCGITFPRRAGVKYIPYNIVISHQEQWLYPDPQKTGIMVPSGPTRLTVKYYCIRRTCIQGRFPYYDCEYLEILPEVEAKMVPSHFQLLAAELSYYHI